MATPLHLASIVHVTDLHLDVTRAGTLREPKDREASLRFILWASKLASFSGTAQALFDGMRPHHPKLREAFARKLDEVIDEHQGTAGDTPLIIVQSGDMEAYGANFREPSAPYQAFDYWNEIKRRYRGSGVSFIDQFGNHDIWPGTHPVLSAFMVEWAMLALRQRSEFSQAMPDWVRIPTPGVPIDVYRLNTVNPATWRATLANGKVTPHFAYSGPDGYPRSGTRDPLAELEALVEAATGPAIRIAVLHHPPYFFSTRGGYAGVYDHGTTGAFDGADELGSRLGKLGIHLVLAGHRHAVDPPDAQHVVAGVGIPSAQAPLAGPTVQLVANSPTQDEHVPVERSFSIYRLVMDADTLKVQRTIYATTLERNELEPRFLPRERFREWIADVLT